MIIDGDQLNFRPEHIRPFLPGIPAPREAKNLYYIQIIPPEPSLRHAFDQIQCVVQARAYAALNTRAVGVRAAI